MLKRICDVLLALALLAIFAVPVLCIAVAVRLTSTGPARGNARTTNPFACRTRVALDADRRTPA